VFDLGDKVCLFHSLLLKKVFLDKSEWELIRDKGCNYGKTELQRMGFLIESDAKDSELYEKAQSLVKLPFDLSTLFLVVTNRCNFACKYCFEESNLVKEYKDMSPEIADEVVTWFVRESRKSKKQRWIFFYGGEPLLNYPAIKRTYQTVNYLRQSGLASKIFFNITTNATLITDEVIADALENETTFGISIDGYKTVHNLGRVFSDGSDSFDAVIGGLKKIKEAGCDYSCIVTVGKHNVEHLTDVVEFLINLGVNTIAFNLLLDQPSGPNRMNAPADFIADQLIAAYEILREHGIREGRVTKQLSPLILEEIYRYECDGCGSQVVITPDVRVGPCTGFIGSDKYFVNWTPFFSLENPLFREWTENCALTMPACKSCPSIGICGGGCHYNRIQRTGKINEPDPVFCVYANKVLEWAIKDLVKCVK